MYIGLSGFDAYNAPGHHQNRYPNARAHELEHDVGWNLEDCIREEEPGSTR